MKKMLLLFFLLASFKSRSQVAEGNLTPDHLDFIKGTWKGSGWSMTEKGKSTSTITEHVECRLDCSIYVVDGLGTKYDSATKKDITVHNAFGVMMYDKAKGKWMLRAFKAGYMIESELSFTGAKKFIWSMEIPNVGLMRYTTDFSNGKWVENGEMSRDKGATWFPIMSMTLEKVNSQ